MAQQIPLQAVPNQSLNPSIGGQAVQLNLYQKSTGLFMDVLVDNVPIVSGTICENLNRIVRDAYLGFVGDFVFLDTQGSSDPTYQGLGTRFLLFYLTAADLANGVVGVG